MGGSAVAWANRRPDHPERPMKQSVEQLCTEKGLKMTAQRRVIARVIEDAHDHPDVPAIYDRAVKVDPHISVATVYRTVRLFEDVGILTRHHFADGPSRFETESDEHHDHLIDLASGKVIEFRNREIERLQVAIAKKLGYQLVGHRLELLGKPLDTPKAKAASRRPSTRRSPR